MVAIYCGSVGRRLLEIFTPPFQGQGTVTIRRGSRKDALGQVKPSHVKRNELGYLGLR